MKENAKKGARESERDGKAKEGENLRRPAARYEQAHESSRRRVCTEEQQRRSLSTNAP
jgi:hypothetical protein